MTRQKYQPYSLQFIERVSRVLGDTEKGLSGSEIAMLLHASTIEDIAGPNSTKWRRLVSALSTSVQRSER